MAGSVDDARVFQALLRIEPAIVLGAQHLGKADDRIERRAQFMAHRRQELALDVVRAQRLGMAALAGFLGGATRRHVAHHADDGGTVRGSGTRDTAGLHLQPERNR